MLVPKDQQKLAEQILGKDSDEQTAWQIATKNSLQALKNNPEDVYARFNLSVAYYNTGDYQKSIEEFEKIENQLSARTLWYQIEPIKAYYAVGNYDKVFTITDQILNNDNRAFSELYIIRGDIYKKQGENDLAKAEYEKAVFYNTNLKAAKDALTTM